MDYLVELQKIEKASQDAKIQKAKLEQKLEQLQDDQKTLLAELVALGVTAETLQQTIDTLSMDIENEIEEGQEALK